MTVQIKNAAKAGASPGTLIHIGEHYAEEVTITYYEYNQMEFESKVLSPAALEALELNTNGNVKWINIDGLGSTEVIETVGKLFKLHPLMLEDILNTGQRTKVEDYAEYLFVVLKDIIPNVDLNDFRMDQISFILIGEYLITFKENGDNTFEKVIARMSAGKGNIRRFKKDYLFYALVDTVVDSYFVLLEQLGNKIDSEEDELMRDPRKEILQNIHYLKREMLLLRNTLWPLREVLSNLIRTEGTYISASTNIYMRDTYDHTIQVIDTIEIYHDILSGMLDTYLSSISNKTNEIMKVLTILSTIFIPITFLAGVYGMNFDFMPELRQRLGYPFFWGVSITSTVVMLRFFRNKKWI